MIKRSLVRKLPSYGRLSRPAFSPSWQPHHHDVNHISIRSRVNSGLKTFSGAKPCVFSGEMASVVARREQCGAPLFGSSCFVQQRGGVGGVHPPAIGSTPQAWARGVLTSVDCNGSLTLQKPYCSLLWQEL